MKKGIIILCINLLVISFSSCKAQLLPILNNSENKRSDLFYFDKKGTYYHRGYIGQFPINILYESIAYDKKSDNFSVEGYTVLISPKDTTGYCCVNIFLAVTLNDSIFNIRPIGKSNSSDWNPKEKNGFFSFKTKLFPNDKLFFDDGSGGGILEFKIGLLTEAVSKKK